MGGSPSHPSSSHPPTSLRTINFQGQLAAFGSPSQWSPNTVFYSRWKLTPRFQVPPTAIVVSFLHIPSQSSCNKFNMLFTFIDLLHKVHSHHTFTFSSCFSMVIPVLGLITNLGETGCYIFSLDQTSFLSTELQRSSRIPHTRATDLCTKISQFQARSPHKASFSPVPNNHSFRSQQWNHLLAQG
jgi:hypothetical protein